VGEDTMTNESKTDKPEGQQLADFLCFAVYSANLTFGKAYKPVLEQLGLTYTQYITLVALWEEDHQTVSGLGEKLFLESNTVTPMLKKLESMGFVRRERDPADERQVRVSLTDEGRGLHEKARSVSMCLLDAVGLTPEEFAVTRSVVLKLRNNLFKSLKD
jgi:DNA-binding MarR family transcriptional regulator